MKYLLGAAMALGFGTSAALASGPSLMQPVHTPPHMAMSAASWTGFYAGGALGYGSTNYDLGGSFNDGTTTASLNLPDLGGQGGLFGLQAGYNFQTSDRLVLGMQLDGAVTGIENDASFSLTDGLNTLSGSYTLRPRAMYTLSGRVGYLATPDTMVYGLLGYTRARFAGDLEASLNGAPIASDSYSFSLNGVAVGVGMETRVARNVTLGVEYRYNHMRRYSLYDGPAFGGTLEAGFRTSIHTARVSMNVHF